MSALSPKAAVRLDKGVALHKAGDYQGALKLYNGVLKKQPSQPDALWLKGTVFIQMGNPAEAIPILERAVKLRPHEVAIWNDIGMALEAIGDAEGAYSMFEKAVELDSTLAPAQVNLARYLLKAEQPEAALDAATKAIASQPELSNAYNVKGNTLRVIGRMQEALQAYATALSHDPNNAEYLCGKGLVLYDSGDFPGALNSLERALVRAIPNTLVWFDATMTLGLVMVKVGDFSKALEHYTRLLDVDPNHDATLNNRGALKQQLGDIEGAEADFATAMRSNPNNKEARYNLSRLELLQGQWAKGWDNHEIRWLTKEFDSRQRDRGLPAWDGSADNEGYILIWGEQGVGDQILFAGSLADVMARGIKPVLEVDPRLMPLLKRHFPSLMVFGYDTVPGDVLKACNTQIAIGSLGRITRRTFKDFSTSQPYLSADPQRVSEIKAKYQIESKGRPLIGISWYSMNPSFGASKSIPLEEWKGILTGDNAFFVSLQYGDVEEDVARVKALTGTHIYVDPEIDHMANLDDAAAQIKALNLVISIDNTTVNLAGALGCEVWVMVQEVPEWRWGLTSDTTPWYPGSRIFRQQKAGHWDAALDSVGSALRNKMKV